MTSYTKAPKAVKEQILNNKVPMRTVEELQKDLINGFLERGMYESTNEDGEQVVVLVETRGAPTLTILTYQKNNYCRKNIYTYDYPDWVTEEMFEFCGEE